MQDNTYREFSIGKPREAESRAFEVTVTGRTDRAKALLETAMDGSSSHTLEGADPNNAIDIAKRFIDGLLIGNAI